MCILYTDIPNTVTVCVHIKYTIQEWIGTYNASKNNEAYICYTKSWLNDYKETQLSPLFEPCPP